MKFAFQWALSIVYWLTGWAIASLISTDTVVSGGLFFGFFFASMLLGVQSKRSIATAVPDGMGEQLEPAANVVTPDATAHPGEDSNSAPAKGSAVESPSRPRLTEAERVSLPTFTPAESQSPTFSSPDTNQSQLASERERVKISTQTQGVRQYASGSKRRSRRHRTFDPDHYRRHTGVPGYLYIARNECHQVGLYKIGYTTLDPTARIKTLNQEHSHASDVGSFALVHAVAVGGSYDAEQALFDAIAETRVAAKREYFFERSDYLKRAVQAASQFNNGNPDALNDFMEWSLDQDSWEKYRPPPLSSTTVPPKLTSSDGWIYVARNQWHRESIVRIGHSIHDPQIVLAKLNKTQRELTCQIGFYSLTRCVLVEDAKVAFSKIAAILRKHRVSGSRTFFEIPSEHLTEAFGSAAMTQGMTLTQIPPENAAQIWVDTVPDSPHPSWRAWTAHCPSCSKLLRFRGACCAVGLVSCPWCGGQIHCRIGPSGSETRAAPDPMSLSPQSLRKVGI